MTQAQLAQGNAPLLAVRDVSVVFGGIIALNGVTFDMQRRLHRATAELEQHILVHNCQE